MRFFVGLHRVNDAHRFARAFISVNVLQKRRSDFRANEWILDSGAFTTIYKYGRYPDAVNVYAARIRRWSDCGDLLAAVSQDYMCEAEMLERTGLSIKEHQSLTVERFRALRWQTGRTYLMPVLQGFHANDYLAHLDDYGDDLHKGAWVGVGSVCKRNGSPSEVAHILRSIKRKRPDLNLHGFGLKITALTHADVRDCLYSSDSMAWSFSERMAGRSPNHWSGAARFVDRIERGPVQLGLPIWE